MRKLVSCLTVLTFCVFGLTAHAADKKAAATPAKAAPKKDNGKTAKVVKAAPAKVAPKKAAGDKGNGKTVKAAPKKAAPTKCGAKKTKCGAKKAKCGSKKTKCGAKKANKHCGKKKCVCGNGCKCGDNCKCPTGKKAAAVKTAPAKADAKLEKTKVDKDEPVKTPRVNKVEVTKTTVIKTDDKGNVIPTTQKSKGELDVPTPPNNSALSSVISSQILRICVRTDIPPFAFFRGETMTGFDIALAKEIATQMGIRYGKQLKVHWNVINASARVSSLQDSKCDLVVAALSATPTRAKEIGLSRSYLSTNQIVIKRKKITNKIALIGVVKGTTSDASAIKGIVNTFLNYNEILTAMRQNLVDYVVTDQPIALYMMRSVSAPFMVHSTLKKRENYCVGVNKKHVHLLKEINRVLDTLDKNGRLDYLKQRWL
jgi:polar amino acid transport system substrate-binding protein